MITAYRDPIRDDTAVICEDEEGLELAHVKRGECYATGAGNVFCVVDFHDCEITGLTFEVRRVHPIRDGHTYRWVPASMASRDTSLIPMGVE